MTSTARRLNGFSSGSTDLLGYLQRILISHDTIQYFEQLVVHVDGRGEAGTTVDDQSLGEG